MKNLILSLLSILFLTMSLYLPAQSADPEALGVWKYQSEDFEGISIISPTHFIWIISNKDRSDFSHSEPTNEEKAKAFEAVNIGAGTWSSTGNKRNKMTYTHHANPNLVGNSFEYEYERDGDIINYWIIQKNGKRGDINHARKLADWNATGSCKVYNGVWDYEGFGESAIYMQSGNYGAWVILDAIDEDLSTTIGKAKAFDATNASGVIGDCNNGKKEFWNVLHSADIRNETEVISTISKKLDNNYYHWEMLTAQGQPSGMKWKTKRIAQ